MRIIEIGVTGLFGVFNHTIPLNIDERVTIIHGPNGFGKTVLLKMLDGLFNRRYDILREIPFKQFEVKFDNGNRLWIEEETHSPKNQKQLSFLGVENTDNIPKGKNGSYHNITINFSSPRSNDTESFSLGTFYESDILPGLLTREIPYIERIGARSWLDISTGEKLSYSDVLDRYGSLLPFAISSTPEWWVEIDNIFEIHFIETQRLLIWETSTRPTRHKTIPAITKHAEDLADTIQEMLTESADLNQTLDRTFPARLVEQMGQSNLTTQDLQKNLSKLEKKRSQLKEVGLLDKEDDQAFLPTKEIGESAKEVLEIYVKDSEKKLAVFDDIANKLTLFKQIINKRFLYKQIVISKQNGFKFVSTIDGKTVPITALSSGEQHELVLLYHLLFKVEPNSLILIDEPELSLHVAWQHEFLQDLQNITELVSFDILIATHSPQIIHNRWDLTVELEGPVLA